MLKLAEFLLFNWVEGRVHVQRTGRRNIARISPRRTMTEKLGSNLSRPPKKPPNTTCTCSKEAKGCPLVCKRRKEVQNVVTFQGIQIGESL